MGQQLYRHPSRHIMSSEFNPRAAGHWSLSVCACVCLCVRVRACSCVSMTTIFISLVLVRCDLLPLLWPWGDSLTLKVTNGYTAPALLYSNKCQLVLCVIYKIYVSLYITSFENNILTFAIIILPAEISKKKKICKSCKIRLNTRKFSRKLSWIPKTGSLDANA